MATNRRIVSQEKTHLDQDEVQQQPSITTPAVPQYAEFIHRNSTYAGATAAIIANFVLIGYVIVAMREDAGEQAEAEEKDKSLASIQSLLHDNFGARVCSIF
ncbi:unnamed protein product [Aureobasidium mustum]|uniref:Uncharacterized protein n=1 Tax=Aureobasidium mustum TaxID=2773714 RepID=A0A9N8P8P8_9PEZI|nr:unnamed protein product [Aureobasidium mustum]